MLQYLEEFLGSGDHLNFFSQSSFGKVVNHEFVDGKEKFTNHFPHPEKILERIFN